MRVPARSTADSSTRPSNSRSELLGLAHRVKAIALLASPESIEMRGLSEEFTGLACSPGPVLQGVPCHRNDMRATSKSRCELRLGAGE